MTDEDRDIVEVIIACCDGQMGREAAVEIIEHLEQYGYEIVRKQAKD